MTNGVLQVSKGTQYLLKPGKGVHEIWINDLTSSQMKNCIGLPLQIFIVQAVMVTQSLSMQSKG